MSHIPNRVMDIFRIDIINHKLLHAVWVLSFKCQGGQLTSPCDVVGVKMSILWLTKSERTLEVLCYKLDITVALVIDIGHILDHHRWNLWGNRDNDLTYQICWLYKILGLWVFFFWNLTLFMLNLAYMKSMEICPLQRLMAIRYLWMIKYNHVAL